MIPQFAVYIAVAVFCGVEALRSSGWAMWAYLIPAVVLGGAVAWTVLFLVVVGGGLNLLLRRVDPSGPRPRELAREMIEGDVDDDDTLEGTQRGGSRRDVPHRSALCEDGEHHDCPHWMGGVAALWGRDRRTPKAILCLCECHKGCPAATGRTVPEESWRSTCTCPGATELRAGHGRPS